MSGDPSRRPSNERMRIGGDANDLVWVKCSYCLGDGWHYPGHSMMPDRSRKTHKQTCGYCGGSGARQLPKLLCGPDTKIVAAPVGWTAQ